MTSSGGTFCLVMGLVFKTSGLRRESWLVGSIPMCLRQDQKGSGGSI